MEDRLIVLDKPDQIEAFKFLARKGSLSLECKGMTRHGRSAYSICKQVYGLKGSKTKVLAQMEKIWEEKYAQ